MKIVSNIAEIEGSSPSKGPPAKLWTDGNILGGYAAAVEWPSYNPAVLVRRRRNNRGLILVTVPDEKWLADLRADDEFEVLSVDLAALGRDGNAGAEVTARLIHAAFQECDPEYGADPSDELRDAVAAYRAWEYEQPEREQ